MRRKISLVILLGISLFVCGLSISSASPDNQEKQKKERSHHKIGRGSREAGPRSAEVQQQIACSAFCF